MSHRSRTIGAWLAGWLPAAAVVLGCSGRCAAAGRPAWLGPENWVWWLLFGSLGALAVVLLVLRTVGYRRLSGFWQCAVASVLAHVALTAGMSLVVISRPVLSLLTRAEPDESSVNLVVGEEYRLRTAIRHQLSELPVKDPMLASLLRAAPEAIRSPEVQLTELPAPASEPQAAELPERPEPPAFIPPAPAEYVRPRAAECDPRDPTVDETWYEPVARAEPPPRADADRPVRPDKAPARPDDVQPRVRAAPETPRTHLDARSIVQPASPIAAPLPRQADEAVVPRSAAEPPDVEVPRMAAPRPAAEERPAPPPRAPDAAIARHPASVPSRPADVEPLKDVPSAEPTTRSIAVAAERVRPRPEPPEPAPLVPPRPSPRAPSPSVLRPARPAASAEARPAPAETPAEPFARQPPEQIGPASCVASLPSLQRIAPAEPRGSALSGHLRARIGPRIADSRELEHVRPPLAVTPLGLLVVQQEQLDPDKPPLPDRSKTARKEIIMKAGGTMISEAAVQQGLAYLAANQEPDGRWTYINEDDDQPGKRPSSQDDMGLTGLALLCFLADGDRPDRRGKYQKNVANGLACLVLAQKPTGDLRGNGDMYSHGIATLALGEAAAITRNPQYAQAAIDGAKFIVGAQHRSTGGWRYAPGDTGDTSVLGWQIMALYSVSRLKRFEIPDATRRGALAWLNSASSGRHGMKTGYLQARATPTMTAEGLFVRILLGQELTEPKIAEATEYLEHPKPTALPDLYYWYYGSLALMQLQSPAWRTWNDVVRERLIGLQRDDGSWDPTNDIWTFKWSANRGGRIYTTALATLTLEVYYRYLPMLRKKPR